MTKLERHIKQQIKAIEVNPLIRDHVYTTGLLTAYKDALAVLEDEKYDSKS